MLPSGGHLNFWRFFIFLLLPKESFPPIFNPKIQFQVVWVPQTQTLPFKLGENGSNFWGSFDGGWKTFRGSSTLKIWKRSDKKWGEIRCKLNICAALTLGANRQYYPTSRYQMWTYACLYSLGLTGPYQNGFKSLRQLATPGSVIDGLSQSRPALRGVYPP